MHGAKFEEFLKTLAFTTKKEFQHQATKAHTLTYCGGDNSKSDKSRQISAALSTH